MFITSWLLSGLEVAVKLILLVVTLPVVVFFTVASSSLWHFNASLGITEETMKSCKPSIVRVAKFRTPKATICSLASGINTAVLAGVTFYHTGHMGSGGESI